MFHICKYARHWSLMRFWYFPISKTMLNNVVWMRWDSWLLNLAWNLPFLVKVPFSDHNLVILHWRMRWLMMKGKPNWNVVRMLDRIKKTSIKPWPHNNPSFWTQKRPWKKIVTVWFICLYVVQNAKWTAWTNPRILHGFIKPHTQTPCHFFAFVSCIVL